MTVSMLFLAKKTPLLIRKYSPIFFLASDENKTALNINVCKISREYNWVQGSRIL